MSSSVAAGSYFLNRSLFICDNLDLLRNLDNESVDLVCTDPPFAKNQTFKGKIKPSLEESEIAAERKLLSDWGVRSRNDAEAAGILWPYDQEYNDAWFKDIWRYKKVVHEDWTNQIAVDWEAVSKVIDAALSANGENMAAYLTYMAVRMIEIHRVLKPTGSLYLHCDPTASHYLKTVLDAIFGSENFRNEIVWRIGWVSGYKTQKRGWILNHDIILYYLKSEEAAEKFNKEYLPYSEGYVRRDGKPPTGQGIPIEDTWNCSENDRLDSIMIKSLSDEKTGYPTQKNIALAERIIRASTDEGDVVLDPFAGCAYVPVAAERNRRQWIACDISVRALTVLRRQFKKFHYKIDNDPSAEEGKLELLYAEIATRSPNDLPVRTDEDPIKTPRMKPLPKLEYKVPSSDIPEDEMKRILLEFSDWQAWCCGFANRMPDGTIIETTDNFHLDHIDPKSNKGSNQIMNRAPLCPAHNSRKKDREITLKRLRDEIEQANELKVNSRDDLVDLVEAREYSMSAYKEWPAKQNK